MVVVNDELCAFKQVLIQWVRRVAQLPRSVSTIAFILSWLHTARHSFPESYHYTIDARLK